MMSDTSQKTPGRPQLPIEKKRKKVVFSLPPIVEEKAREACEKLQIPLSQFVEKALINEITRTTFGKTGNE